MTEKEDAKYVKFDYFQVQVSKTKNKNAKKAETRYFDLTKWMDMIRPKFEKDPKEVTFNFYGEQIRCDRSEMVDINTSMPLARLHFTKLREKNSPAVGTINDVQLDPVKLGPDEFIAEDVTALFDPSDSVLMLQKNIYSLSRGALEAYINLLWNKDRNKENYEYIHLVPIFQKENFSKGKRGSVYTSVGFQTANKASGAAWVNPFHGQIGQVFDSTESLKGLNIDVKISASRKKNSGLDRSTVIKLIDQIEKQANLIGKAEVTFKDQNDNTTYVDLMNGKVQSKLLFNVPKKMPLAADNVWTAMLAEYRPSGNNMVQTVKENMNVIAVD